MATEFLFGIYGTLSMACLAWAFGLPVGVGLSFWSLRFSRYGWYLSALSIAFAALPFLAVLFWFHYPLQSILGVVWSPFFTSVLLLAVFVAISSGEILAAEMREVRKGILDSADVLGIPTGLLIRRVIFPTATQNALPRLLTLAVGSIHMTMFSSLIGVEELFRISMRINAEYLQPIKVFTVMALIYMLMCLPLYYLSHRLSKRLKANAGST